MAQSIYDEEMRRRRLQEALLKQSMPQGTQYTGGAYSRAIPYSPLQGLTTLGQALIARQGREESEGRLKEEIKKQEDKRKRLSEAVMRTHQGTPAVPAVTADKFGPPQFPDEQQVMQEAVPAVPGDPTGAMLQAAAAPETEKMANVLSAMQRGRGSAAKPTATSRGFLVPDPTNPSGYRVIKDPTGEPYLPPYVDPAIMEQVAKGKEKGKVTGKERTTAAIDLPAVESNAEYLKGLVRQASVHPGFESVVGAPSPGKVTQFIPGTEAAGFKALQDQITGKQFMQAYETLKGGGQITELEGQKATDALSRMKTSQSEAEYKKAADEFITEIDRLTALAEQRATGAAPTKKETYVETRTLPDGRVLGKKADGTIEEVK